MRYILLICLVLTFLGCSENPQEKILANINGYELSVQDFEESFQQSYFALRPDQAQARQEFLEKLINERLILQYAQKENLDKTPAFLKKIEKFWEASLLKVALDYKSSKLQPEINPDDEMIKEQYQDMLKDASAQDKKYSEVYQQIRWKLIREKESKMFSDWIDDMKRQADISIEEKYLGGQNGQ
jgi:hypothetical protein